MLHQSRWKTRRLLWWYRLARLRSALLGGAIVAGVMLWITALINLIRHHN